MHKRHLVRRLAGVTLTAAVAAGTMLAGAAPGNATPATVYYSIKAGPPSQVTRSVHVSTTQNHEQVVLQEDLGQSKGQWEKFVVGPPVWGGVQFKNRYSHQCLESTSLVSGAAVYQDVCDANQPGQWWIEVADPVLPADRYFNAFTFQYLTAANAAFTAGSGIIQRPTQAGSIAQMWRVL